MGRALLVMAGVGGALLLVVTVILVVLNWSERLYAPLFSIVLGGTVTTLIAILSLFKPSSVQVVFNTSVLWDSARGGPAFVTTHPIDSAVNRRLSDLMTYGAPVVTLEGQLVTNVPAPTSLDETFTYCGELLQYQLIRVIEEIQRGGTRITVSAGTVRTDLHPIPRITRIARYSGMAVLPTVASNRFAASRVERFHWENAIYPLPAGTVISALHETASPGGAVERFIVRLRKRSFFTVDIIVEPIISPGPGVIPQGVNFSPEARQSISVYNYQVMLRADFEKLTAGNWQTAEFQDWVNWLFDQLRTRMAD